MIWLRYRAVGSFRSRYAFYRVLTSVGAVVMAPVNMSDQCTVGWFDQFAMLIAISPQSDGFTICP